jgi:hypothetical protein
MPPSHATLYLQDFYLITCKQYTKPDGDKDRVSKTKQFSHTERYENEWTASRSDSSTSVYALKSH